MQNVMPNFDELGPVKVIHVHVPAAGLDGVLVVDNAGPAIGGLRMAPDVDAIEAARLARTMTLKNAAAGIRQRRQISDRRRPEAAPAVEGGAGAGLRLCAQGARLHFGPDRVPMKR
jgi:hypothetical protein